MLSHHITTWVSAADTGARMRTRLNTASPKSTAVAIATTIAVAALAREAAIVAAAEGSRCTR